MMAEHTANSEKSQRRTGEVVPLRKDKLQADRTMIAQFANAVYPKCQGVDGYIALRSFTHEKAGKCVLKRSVKFRQEMISEIVAAATETANFATPAAFAPPVCLFKTSDSAKVRDIAAAPVISVDLDSRPEASKVKLETVLGEATLVVASGGVWTDPDNGETQAKQHLYWRLVKPATTPEELTKLRLARDLTAVLVNADETNNPISHPLRCPGSFHTKADIPRLCSIVGGNAAREIDLDEALEKLERAAGHLLVDRRKRHGVEKREGFKTPRAWTEQALTEVANRLSSENWEWEEWNKIGMAMFDASHGSDEGREAFHELSGKSPKYDPFHTDGRWDHYHDYPPSDLSGGTLTHRMQEIDPLWLPTWPREGIADGADIFALDGNDGPLDIFANGNPAQLSNLPANAVPPMLERVIKSEARRKGTPEAFAIVSTITVIGAAIGADIRVQVRQHDDTWTEAANLWAVVVADPGSAKSPVIGAAVKPLKKVDAEWVNKDQAVHDKWAAASRNKKKDAPEAGPEPRIRRAVVDDVTSEKQIRIFRDNPRGVLRTPDELAGLLGGFGQYKSGGGADREHFLRSFDGDTITADRVGSGTITALRASLAVLAGTQPDRMRDLIKNLGADGLLQRFLVVLHDGRDREALDEEPDREAAEWYETTIRRLTAAEYVFPDPVRLNPEAGKILAAADKQIKLLRNIPGASIQLKSHIEKWGKILPRLILITHVTRKMTPGESFDPHELIEPDTVAMAVRLASFFLDHALHFYMTYFGAATATSEARWIAEHLLAHPDVKIVSRKYLGDVRKVYRGQDGQRTAGAAMTELENFGWCWVNEWEANGPKSWCIDARAHERFAETAERVRQERREKRQKIIASGNARALLRDGMEAEVLAAEDVFG